MALTTPSPGKPEGTLPRRCHHLIPIPRDGHARLGRSDTFWGRAAMPRLSFGTAGAHGATSTWHQVWGVTTAPGTALPPWGAISSPGVARTHGHSPPLLRAESLGAESVAQGAASRLPLPTPQCGLQQPPHGMLLGTTTTTPCADAALVPRPSVQAAPALPKGGHDATVFPALHLSPAPSFAPVQVPAQHHTPPCSIPHRRVPSILPSQTPGPAAPRAPRRVRP